MTLGRLLYLNLGVLIMTLFASGCGKIWSSVTYFNNQNNSSALAYSCSTQVFLEGYSNNSNGPSNSVSGTTYAISPTLPLGLSFNSSTGIISGTPTVATAMTAYTVTGVGPNGTTSTTINIRTASGYLVNDLSDAHNVGPGCSTAGGTCTLRAAIEEVNSVGPPNVILVPTGIITLTLGSNLTVNSSMDIYGNCSGGTVVDGNLTTRVFLVGAGPSSLNNLTVQHGVSTSNGGGIQIGTGFGGPNFSASLTSLIVQNNAATTGTNGGGIEVNNGGGAFWPTVTISDSVIQNNSASSGLGNGGGLSIDTGTVVTVTNTSFLGNSAYSGGAVLVNGAGTISQCFMGSNSASSAGGAVYCSQASGSITLTNDTIYGNTSTAAGGIGTANSAVISVLNSTIVGNSSTGSTTGAGIGDVLGATSIQVANTIIAANTDTSGLHDCTPGPLVSVGYNISDDSTCAFSLGTDQPNTNPDLGSVQNNGGLTETLALLSGSPAIGAILNSSCPSTDQRGAIRPSNGCDIGAYEYTP